MSQDQGQIRSAKPQSLEEWAYHQLKQNLLDGTLSPGELLVETQLAQDLGISKTPIRKALTRLQEEDFLVNVPYKGHYVAEISAEDIREIYQLRRIIECHLVRETALLFTPSELDEMETNVNAATEAFERGDMIRYIEYNRAFHHFFPHKHGNRRISKQLTNLDEHIQRILLHKLNNTTDDLLSPHQHQAIVQAIRNGDVDSAVGLMYDHLSVFD